MNRCYQTPSGEFEWNAEKADINHKKHGVTFEQAADAFGLVFYDTANSLTEDRFQLLGMSGCSLILFVVFVERGSIRIISARKATRKEERLYDGNRKNF